MITVPHSVRISGPELFFEPQKQGLSCLSLPDMTWKSIMDSDIDVRKDLAKNIILSGGSTMYEGIADRLKSELVSRAPASAEIRVMAAADRKYAVWKGASTLASLSTFGSSWLTMKDYEEHGSQIVHRKFS